MTDLFTPISDGEYNPFDDGTDVPRLVKGESEPDLTLPDDPLLIMQKEAKKFKKADHNLRTRELFEKEGWTVLRVDQTRTSYSGSIYTVDFMGLFDWIGLKPGRQMIGIQVCHKNGIGSHVTKMTSTEITSFNKARKIDNLNTWLSCGFRAILVGWCKEGHRWVPTTRELDTNEVSRAMSRKRKSA